MITVKENRMIEEKKIQSDTLNKMKESSYNYDSTRWAAYQNLALDSASAGHIQFLAIGPENTFKEPPKHLPDTTHGLGWKYLFQGWIDLETGEIREVKNGS